MSAVKAVRRVQERGSGFFDPDLGNALVPDLCVVNKSSSLWELLVQIMASRVISPIHALALLISRAGKDGTPTISLIVSWILISLRFFRVSRSPFPFVCLVS